MSPRETKCQILRDKANKQSCCCYSVLCRGKDYSFRDCLRINSGVCFCKRPATQPKTRCSSTREEVRNGRERGSAKCQQYKQTNQQSTLVNAKQGTTKDKPCNIEHYRQQILFVGKSLRKTDQNHKCSSKTMQQTLQRHSKGEKRIRAELNFFLEK